MTIIQLLSRIDEIRLSTGNTKLTIILSDGEKVVVEGENTVKCLWRFLNKGEKKGSNSTATPDA